MTPSTPSPAWEQPTADELLIARWMRTWGPMFAPTITLAQCAEMARDLLLAARAADASQIEKGEKHEREAWRQVEELREALKRENKEICEATAEAVRWQVRYHEAMTEVARLKAASGEQELR